MSGDTLEPAGFHYSVTEAVNSIRKESTDPWHLVFAAHLEKVALAVRALDLELSADTGEGSAREAIRDCLTDADLLAYHLATTGGAEGDGTPAAPGKKSIKREAS